MINTLRNTIAPYSTFPISFKEIKLFSKRENKARQRKNFENNTSPFELKDEWSELNSRNVVK
jgi:hypothetical protein